MQREHAGAVIWITGLSGSGKSTVAREVVAQLDERGISGVILDGDELRDVLGVPKGFDRESRRQLAHTYARLCRLLSGQGCVVVCATISLFHEVHQWNRANVGRYLEVFLEVPIQELVRRNSKSLYGRGDHATQVAGLDVEVEFPVAPDLVLPNSGRLTASSSARRILEFFVQTR